MIFAAGAMPVRGEGPASTPVPAMMPAMTRPARSLTAATPVSRTATLTPAPLIPLWKALPACEVQTYDELDVVSSHDAAYSFPDRSAVTARTPGRPLSSASRLAGTVAD